MASLTGIIFIGWVIFVILRAIDQPRRKKGPILTAHIPYLNPEDVFEKPRRRIRARITQVGGDSPSSSG